MAGAWAGPRAAEGATWPIARHVSLTWRRACSASNRRRVCSRCRRRGCSVGRCSAGILSHGKPCCLRENGVFCHINENAGDMRERGRGCRGSSQGWNARQSRILQKQSSERGIPYTQKGDKQTLRTLDTHSRLTLVQRKLKGEKTGHLSRNNAGLPLVRFSA